MGMVDITVSQIVNDVIVLAAGLASVFGIGKSDKVKAFFGFIKKEAPAIVAGVEAVLHTPAAKAVEGELHHKLNVAIAKAEESELGRLAAQGLHALGVSLKDASPEQLDALALHIATLIPGVSRQKIDDALKVAQEGSDVIASVGVIIAANQFTQEKSDAKISASKVAGAEDGQKQG